MFFCMHEGGLELFFESPTKFFQPPTSIFKNMFNTGRGGQENWGGGILLDHGGWVNFCSCLTGKHF